MVGPLTEEKKPGVLVNGLEKKFDPGQFSARLLPIVNLREGMVVCEIYRF